MYYFCTYFDKNNMDKGLALYYSLVRHCQPFHLFVLCMDHETNLILGEMKLPDLTPINLLHFEEGDIKLLEAKKNRSKIEYYFTCTPSLIQRVMEKNPDIDVLTYLDADLYFFGSVEPAYKELGDNSIMLIEHRFPDNLKHLEKYGKYNVGLLSFRNDANGQEALNWWRDRCLEWCYDRVEGDKFADQGYLNDWTERFKGVVVLQHKGIGLAPYNLANYNIYSWGHSFRLRHAESKVYIDKDPLIMYHFHGVKQVGKCLWDVDVCGYKTRLPKVVKNEIYVPYLKELALIRKKKELNRLWFRIEDIRKLMLPVALEMIRSPYKSVSTPIRHLRKNLCGDFISVKHRKRR